MIARGSPAGHTLPTGSPAGRMGATDVDVLGIDNVFFQVGDLDSAVDFYTRVVGLEVHKRFDAMGTVLFQVGTETPGLGVGVTDDPVAGRIWFEVADAQATARALTDRGASLTAPCFHIPTGWAVEITDPWGNTLGFTDYTSAPDLGRT